MRQRFVDIHHLRAKRFKLEPLLVPERLTGQTRRNFTGVNGERRTIAEPITAQCRNFLAVDINNAAGGRLHRGQPQAIHTNPFKRRILPGILNQLLQ
ncbi:Uncharacterised protein [Shigella sonnei]|nr:Uncharacterised protein [Shigella sonnei]